MNPLQARPSPPRSVSDAPLPFKHVIERYVHRARQVTCTCGWQGSSLDGAADGWKAHLAAVSPRER